MAELSKVRKMIDEVLRSAPVEVTVDEQGDYVVRVDNVIIYARPAEWQDQAVVRIWSISNVGMRVDGELSRMLLMQNASMPLGGFRLDERGPAVMATHTILADDLSGAEFAMSALVVGQAVEQLGPQIKQLFGGKLFGES